MAYPYCNTILLKGRFFSNCRSLRSIICHEMLLGRLILWKMRSIYTCDMGVDVWKCGIQFIICVIYFWRLSLTFVQTSSLISLILDLSFEEVPDSFYCSLQSLQSVVFKEVFFAFIFCLIHSFTFLYFCSNFSTITFHYWNAYVMIRFFTGWLCRSCNDDD